MTFFVLFVSVPALLFCCLALVHFQQEILKGHRTRVTVGEKIALDRQDDVVLEVECDMRSAKKNAQNEVFQIESVYLGPFFVVRAENGSDWEFTNTCDNHHQLLSAVRG